MICVREDDNYNVYVMITWDYMDYMDLTWDYMDLTVHCQKQGH